jgi:hypothetical protein
LIPLNASVFDTHAQNASAPGGKGGTATARSGNFNTYCTGPRSCYIVGANASASGGKGGQANIRPPLVPNNTTKNQLPPTLTTPPISLIGTWHLSGYDKYGVAAGQITFNRDGTWSMAARTIGSGTWLQIANTIYLTSSTTGATATYSVNYQANNIELQNPISNYILTR